MSRYRTCDFEARGEEGAAFGPPAETLSQAFFISEHIHMGAHHYDFGLRVERQTIDSTGNDYSDTAFSISLAKIWNIDEQQSIAISLQRTQRHPTSTELFANGAHLATSQFEIGDDSLDLETAMASTSDIAYEPELEGDGIPFLRQVR